AAARLPPGHGRRDGAGRLGRVGARLVAAPDHGRLDALDHRVLLPLLVESSTHARDVVRIERRHVILDLDAERTNLIDQVLVAQSHVLRPLVDADLLDSLTLSMLSARARRAIASRLHHESLRPRGTSQTDGAFVTACVKRSLGTLHFKVFA